MKEIASIYVSVNNPDWSCLNFKPSRNKAGVLSFPEPKWIESSIVTELDIKVGDKVEDN